MKGESRFLWIVIFLLCLTDILVVVLFDKSLFARGKLYGDLDVNIFIRAVISFFVLLAVILTNKDT